MGSDTQSTCVFILIHLQRIRENADELQVMLSPYARPCGRIPCLMSRGLLGDNAISQNNPFTPIGIDKPLRILGMHRYNALRICLFDQLSNGPGIGMAARMNITNLHAFRNNIVEQVTQCFLCFKRSSDRLRRRRDSGRRFR